MKIVHKLGLLVLITVIGMLVLGGGATWQLKRFQALLDDSETTIASIQLLADARGNFLDYNGLVLLHVINTDGSRMQALESEMAEQRKLVDASLKAYEGLVADPEDQRLLDDERQRSCSGYGASTATSSTCRASAVPKRRASCTNATWVPSTTR
ncbi:hypothetical protein QF022_000512 [Vogesella perlucida]|nr:hypothetical protein [Vogesella perlucida]